MSEAHEKGLIFEMNNLRVRTDLGLLHVDLFAIEWTQILGPAQVNSSGLGWTSGPLLKKKMNGLVSIFTSKLTVESLGEE